MESNNNMDTEQNEVTGIQEKKILPFVAVAILTTLLGFAAGYIASPEKIVEVEKIVETEVEIEVEKTVKVDRVVDNAGNELTEVVYGSENYLVSHIYRRYCGDTPACEIFLKTRQGELLSNLSADFIKWRDEQLAENQGKIELVGVEYVSRNSDLFYFRTGIPGSSGCCQLVAYNPKEGEFKEVDLYRGTQSSKVTERGYLVIADLNGKGISVYDLDRYDFNSETFYEVSRVDITDGTMIRNCVGGFFEDDYDMQIGGLFSVFYGVYPEEHTCGVDAIEYRLLSLPGR